MSNIVLEHLQRVEAGLLHEMTPELVDTICNIKYKDGTPVEEICTICGADIIICHHIKTYKRRRKYNGDESAGFNGFIGEIWICPNCHYRIHDGNPYFKNSRR